MNMAIDRIAVQAVIYSGVLAPEEITARLGLQPTNVAVKGLKYGSETGTPVNVPRHMWRLSSEPNVEASNFGKHLDWLLSKLLPVRNELSAIRNSGVVNFHMICVVWTSGTSAHIGISRDQMDALVCLGFDLQLEFSDYGDDG